MTTVTASIVLFNSGPDIEACLLALLDQVRPPDHVIVIDNASTDDGAMVVERVMPAARVERLDRNIGFAAGHNRAFGLAPADVHLVLNPDCRLARDFLGAALAGLDADPSIGAVSGRLLRFREGEEDGGELRELADDILDTTGMVAARNRRVLDRSSEELAAGRDRDDAFVFGASGAAAVYSRAMLDDVAFRGEIFDESFFSFREDVDLAWRALLLGWRCRYVATAVARHRRSVTPARRHLVPARINRISVANRWRMIAKNETSTGWRRDWWAILGRDLGILTYALLREQRTLPAILDVLRDAGRLRAWRRDIMRRRRASDDDVLAWFGRRVEILAR